MISILLVVVNVIKFELKRQFRLPQLVTLILLGRQLDHAWELFKVTLDFDTSIVIVEDYGHVIQIDPLLEHLVTGTALNFLGGKQRF